MSCFSCGRLFIVYVRLADIDTQGKVVARVPMPFNKFPNMDFQGARIPQACLNPVGHASPLGHSPVRLPSGIVDKCPSALRTRAQH